MCVGYAEKKTRPAGLEPAAYGLEIRCSIQLSYGRNVVGILLIFDPNESCARAV
jgi:hypothetical protein